MLPSGRSDAASALDADSPLAKRAPNRCRAVAMQGTLQTAKVGGWIGHGGTIVAIGYRHDDLLQHLRPHELRRPVSDTAASALPRPRTGIPRPRQRHRDPTRPKGSSRTLQLERRPPYLNIPGGGASYGLITSGPGTRPSLKAKAAPSHPFDAAEVRSTLNAVLPAPERLSAEVFCHSVPAPQRPRLGRRPRPDPPVARSVALTLEQQHAEFTHEARPTSSVRCCPTPTRRAGTATTNMRKLDASFAGAATAQRPSARIFAEDFRVLFGDARRTTPAIENAHCWPTDDGERSRRMSSPARIGRPVAAAFAYRGAIPVRPLAACGRDGSSTCVRRDRAAT